MRVMINEEVIKLYMLLTRYEEVMGEIEASDRAVGRLDVLWRVNMPHIRSM